MPCSTPAGISISRTASFFISPFWSTPSGRFPTIWPVPWQVEQVDEVCIAPRMVLATLVICPVPLQVEQLVNSTPSAATSLLTLIFFFTPLTTSLKVNFNLTLRLEPFLLAGPLLPPPKPPPKAPPKMSPKCSNISSIFIPPPPNPCPPIPA